MSGGMPMTYLMQAVTPISTNACGLDCNLCPAAGRCGKTCNFCRAGRMSEGKIAADPVHDMTVRSKIMENLGGLDLTWPRKITHPVLPGLPAHLPVFVQAYADQIEVPWVALHGGRLFGINGRGLTAKHWKPLPEVYRLAPTTKIAIEFNVVDRVLEGLWSHQQSIIAQLVHLHPDLVLTPNFSVWFDDCRFRHLIQIKRSFWYYHRLVEAGLPAVPDIGFSFFEPDGRLWAEWVNDQSGLQAVSLFCGGQKVHANKRHLRETLEDIALFHRAVRPDVAFVLGGVHAPDRLAAYRQAAPGRQLVFCNGMAYSLAQRRRLLARSARAAARSARECFLLNSAHNDRVYASLLNQAELHQMQHGSDCAAYLEARTAERKAGTAEWRK